jgi:YHS domain-containing protein
MNLRRPFLLLPVRAALIAASILSPGLASAEDAVVNNKCPMMTEDEVEEDHQVDFKGTPVALCCGKCERLWKADERAASYYVKVATELGLLPQFKGKEKELGLDTIELLPQRFCPIHQKSLITPASPSLEYQGVKIYFFNEKAKGSWEKDPEAAARKAIDAGVLPQLKKEA